MAWQIPGGVPMPDSGWLVLGAGSIGGLWAARLAQSGKTPTLLLREDRLEAYRHNGGLHLSGEGLVEIEAVSASQLQGAVSQLLVCCKTHQTLPALSEIAQHLDQTTTLVLVQNGLGVAEQIQQRYPELTLVCGSTTQGAYRDGPFTITPAGSGETLLGIVNGSADAVAPLAASLSCQGFPVAASHDILPILWAKLAVNCAINPLSVRYRCRNGELLTNRIARDDLSRVCQEFVAVSKSLGRDSWVADLENRVCDVAAKTARNRSSMLQDIEHRRTTEIEAITGYFCTQASVAGVDVPLSRTLYREVLALHPD